MRSVVEQKGEKTYSLPAGFLQPEQMRPALSGLAWKILNTLSKKPSYSKEISRVLKVHEQKIYYHIRNLEKSGIIELHSTSMKQGAIAKIYKLKNSALALLLKPMEEAKSSFEQKQNKILEPFLEAGSLNALLVVGSPEPHGPTSAMAKDILPALNFALFAGSFLNHVSSSSIRLDTEISKIDLKNNLILIGGPGVNSITKKINPRLPVRFQKIQFHENFYSAIYSSLSGKAYSNENCGMIVRIKNPFESSKHILVIAGKRASGTRAAVLGLIGSSEEISKGNKKRRSVLAKVVEGIDADSDGTVDSVKILE